MGKQNFVNQFKNTRRHAKLQFPRSRAKTGRGVAKPPASRPPWEKASKAKKVLVPS
jgi:hypothetical protein